MQIHICRPTGYDFGAYTVEINLDPSEWNDFHGWPIVFEIPKLNKRALYPDEHYRVAVPVSGSAIEFRGILRDGCWSGHCYSNGIEESENPTPIVTVKRALEANIQTALQIMKAAFTRP